jgi:trimeric autotransporter adhesin
LARLVIFINQYVVREELVLRECRWMLLLLAAVGFALAGCGNNNSPGSTKVTALAISPQSPTIPLGNSQQFTATETLADGSTNDVTSMVTWASSAPKVATVTTGGMVSSVSQGATHISATLGSHKASTLLTISPAALISLTLTPTSIKIAKYTDQQFTAMGSFSNGSTQNISSQVTWSSSQPTIASVNTSGLAVAGSAAGNTVITAKLNQLSASANLTVTNANLQSITVTPADSTIPEGVFRQFVATAAFSDGSTQNISAVTTWSCTSTSTSTVAQVSSSGLLSALGLGSATISATLNNTTGSTDLTVATPTLISVAIQPNDGKVAVGTGIQLTAIGTYNNGSTKNLTSQATWSSSPGGIVSVNASGFANAQSVGAATITATLGSITTSTSLKVTDATLVSIIVTPTTPTIAVGGTKQFTATGSFSDGSTENMSTLATWTSSEKTVAAMTGATATGESGGTVTISAGFGSVTGSTTLTVSTASLTSVNISPASATMSVHGSLQFTLIGHYSNGTTLTLTSAATWSSSDSSDAAISPTGLASGLQGGSVTITASYESFTATAALTVTGATLSSIAVSPATAAIAPGTTRQFVATGIYGDQSTQNLTAFVDWTSSDLSVATISDSSPNLGLATAVAAGTSLIGAELSPVIGSASLSVSNATLVLITVTPPNPSLLLGQSLYFTATGTFSDGTTQDITGSVTWTSSAPTVATVNGSGVSSSASVGTTTITATMNSVSGSTTLTVVQ